MYDVCPSHTLLLQGPTVLSRRSGGEVV